MHRWLFCLLLISNSAGAATVNQNLVRWVDRQAHYSLEKTMINLQLPGADEGKMEELVRLIGLPNLTPQTFRGHLPGNVIASPGAVGEEAYNEQVWSRDGGIALFNYIEVLFAEESFAEHGLRANGFLHPLMKHANRVFLMSFLPDYFGLRETHQNVDHPDRGSVAVYTAEGQPITAVRQWGVPQRDGPAIQAMSIGLALKNMWKLGGEEEARELWYGSEGKAGVLKTDLMDVAQNWHKSTFCCWEEVLTGSQKEGNKVTNFYTMMLQQAALSMGIEIARNYFADDKAADFFTEQRNKIRANLAQLYSPERGYLLSHQQELGGHVRDKHSRLDIYVILGSVYGNQMMGEKSDFFAPWHPYIFATLDHLRNHFLESYPINSKFSGVQFGRYPEDRYNPAKPMLERQPGDGGSWPLATLAAVEVQLQKALHIKRIGELYIYQAELPAMQNLLEPYLQGEKLVAEKSYGQESFEFKAAVNALTFRAFQDLQGLREIIQLNNKVSGQRGTVGPIFEQIHPITAKMTSLPHLTWSYVAFLRVHFLFEYAKAKGLSLDPIRVRSFSKPRKGALCSVAFMR